MKRKQKGLKAKESNWSNDQDSCLIENNSMTIEQVMLFLPFSGNEIKARKQFLGLYKRHRQMKIIE
ncbi:conserved hypothetical protein [Acinetobacter proteolyticus]|uniref:Uncharacterized protein n=1 Tax=Acinetobacter proteolyticus TaxID=1776741 RepID=A0A653K5A2_9GAMM|nr:conserved hypothetical protein [Acinetobacter proteolyticus]